MLPTRQGPPLGVRADLRWETAPVALEAGRAVVLYTDQLVERRGASLDTVLERVLVALGDAAPADLANCATRCSPRPTRPETMTWPGWPFEPIRPSPRACSANVPAMATQEREVTQRPEPPPMVIRLRRRREAYVAKSVVYKAGWVTAGLVVLLAGLAMMVMPGPGLVVIPIGLAMLSLQFAWAEKLLERALVRAASARKTAKGLSRRQKILGGVAVVLGVACVAALGVYLWVI